MRWSDLSQQRWIAAVSGGPDSMAMLELCRRHHLQLICAHVNYHHRPSADRDQQLVEQWCAKHDLPCFVLHAPEAPSGNFQHWARQVRYAFFRSLAQTHQARGVLTAHQLDDFLETAWMQQESGRQGEVLGIRTCGEVEGVYVVRPLLLRSRQWTCQYCERHGIPYGVDESNLTDAYRRNQIRHHQLSRFSEAQKRQMAARIRRRNEAQRLRCQRLRQRLDWTESVISREIYCSLNPAQRLLFLRCWFAHQHVRVPSPAWLRQLDQTLWRRENNWTMAIGDQAIFCLDYGNFSLDLEPEVSYRYVLDTIEMLKTPFFEVAGQGSSVEAVTLYDDDFPITIRSPQPQDAIALRFGRKKLNRWFIDRKIPFSQRRRWPVVVNRHGEIVLIPKIGCNPAHYSNNPTCFVLK